MFVFKRTLLLCALLACPLVLSSNAALRGDRRFLVRKARVGRGEGGCFRKFGARLRET